MTGLPDLHDSETLGRSVVSSTAAKRARRRGLILPEVFLERITAPSISVDRMDRAPREALAALAAVRAGVRTPPRRFRGWAELSVAHAVRDGRTVAATPISGNPWHADILLHIPAGLSDIERRRQQKLHAERLARHAAWREAP